MRRFVFRLGATVLTSALALVPSLAFASGGAFIGAFNTVSTVASTVPSNGDVNPLPTALPQPPKQA